MEIHIQCTCIERLAYSACLAAHELPPLPLQEEAFVEISGDNYATGDAFAELVGMAVEVEPSLADRAARDLAASQRASASVAGAHLSLV